MNRKKLAVLAAVMAVIAVFAVKTGNQSNSAGIQNTLGSGTQTGGKESTEEAAGNAGSSASNSNQGSLKANEADAVTEDTAVYEEFVLDTASLETGASFVSFETGGKEGEFIVIKEEDGGVRVALNTCQICNGSPYAYFEQEGERFICQNCGNPFSFDDIGVRRGGCNPIPLGVTEESEENGSITLSGELMEQCGKYFNNWKEF